MLSKELRCVFPHPIVLDMRALPMKWFLRGVSATVLCVGMLGVLGCGPDNDTEGQQLAKSAGDPGKPNPAGIPAPAKALPPARSQSEAFERSKQQQRDMYKQGGYPGTKK
jgi:hypothetical protein